MYLIPRLGTSPNCSSKLSDVLPLITYTTLRESLVSLVKRSTRRFVELLVFGAFSYAASVPS